MRALSEPAWVLLRTCEAAACSTNRRLLSNDLIQFKVWHVLRRIFRNQPAIIIDGNEDADIHRGTAPIKGRKIRRSEHEGEAMRVPSFHWRALGGDRPGTVLACSMTSKAVWGAECQRCRNAVQSEPLNHATSHLSCRPSPARLRIKGACLGLAEPPTHSPDCGLSCRRLGRCDWAAFRRTPFGCPWHECRC